jgi:hypothetical protein
VVSIDARVKHGDAHTGAERGVPGTRNVAAGNAVAVATGGADGPALRGVVEAVGGRLSLEVDVEVLSLEPEDGPGSGRGLIGARATEWRVTVVEVPLPEVVGSPASSATASWIRLKWTLWPVT